MAFRRWRAAALTSTPQQDGPAGLYEVLNVGQWGKPHWGTFQWAKWNIAAGFPYPAYPEQPGTSRYPRHYGRAVAAIPLGNEFGISANLTASLATSVGKYVAPQVFPEYWRKRYNPQGGAFAPTEFESILPEVPHPQLYVRHEIPRTRWDWRFQHPAEFQVIPESLFGTHVWTEPAASPITSTWTEPAASVVTSTWTEPAASAITSTWTEPAVTPITPSPEVN